MNWKTIGQVEKRNGKFGKMCFWNIYKGKKVLITGDTGFKGSWLAIWLIQLGAEVYGYALPPQSREDNFTTCNVDSLITHQDGDVRNYTGLLTYFHKVKPDIAFHLAAQPLVLLSYQDPAGTFETNLMGVVNFLEAVKNTPSVKVAVNVTSDKCYDNREWIWGYRESDPMGGKDPYSASKGCSELITASYNASFFQAQDSANIASARAGNVIGGGDWAENRIVPDYFRAVKAGKPLELRNPFATRPWQHVLEPLSGYLNLAAKMWSEGNRYSGGWNFGPNDSSNYSVENLINAITKLESSGSYQIAELDKKPHEATYLKLDISKAVNYLQWRPVLTFEETVKLTVLGYQAELNHADLLASRIDQISAYAALAAQRNIDWAQNI